MDNTHAASKDMDRRTALGVLGAAGFGAASFGGLGLGATAASGTTPGLSAKALGWNPDKQQYELPDLPYAADALEPHIDAQTMEIHHGRHHAGYVRGLNNALDQLRKLRNEEADAGSIQHWQRQLSFHAGGHFNHTLFWKGMAPAGSGGGGQPGGSLALTIERDFGSFEKFSWQFQRAAATVEGSGWAWLVFEPHARMLMISQMESQQKLLIPGSIPLLGVDVWEHAYYLNYQNRRPDYVQSFFNVINWDAVTKRFNDANKGASDL